MNVIVERILCVVLGYVLGLFQTGYLLGRVKGVDIRSQGSGNAGTTNVLRVMGKKAGIYTYIGDFIKALVASLLTALIFKNSATDITILVLYSGLGVILGHNFPFYMKFKGGKGIAATSGVIFSLFDWKLIVLGILVFVLSTVISKYVSVGSLSMVTGFLIEFIIFMELGLLTRGINPATICDTANKVKIEAMIMAFVFALLAYFQHRQNILRLVRGNERKIGQKKEE